MRLGDCAGCVFYEGDVLRESFGTCRRYPPLTNPAATQYILENPECVERAKSFDTDCGPGWSENADDFSILHHAVHSVDTSYYPSVHESDWCGEWKQAPEEAP